MRYTAVSQIMPAAPRREPVLQVGELHRQNAKVNAGVDTEL